MNTIRLLVLTACLAPLLALAAAGSSYRVSLGSLHGTAPAAVAKQIAASITAAWRLRSMRTARS